MQASIIGTVQSFNVVEVSSSETSCYISLEGDNCWSIRFDSATLSDLNKLHEGKKYLFHDSLSCHSPTIVVHRIVQELSKYCELGSSEIVLQGEIADIKITQTMRRNELGWLKFKDLPEVDVVLFPDLCKDLREQHKDDNKVSLVGNFETQPTEFIVDKIEPLFR